MADIHRRRFQMNFLAWKLYVILIQNPLKYICKGTVDKKKISGWENDLGLSTRQAISRTNECLVQGHTSAPVNIWYRAMRTTWFRSNSFQLIRMNLRITEAYIHLRKRTEACIRHLHVWHYLDLVKRIAWYHVIIAWYETIITWYAIIIMLYVNVKTKYCIIYHEKRNF